MAGAVEGIRARGFVSFVSAAVLAQVLDHGQGLELGRVLEDAAAVVSARWPG
jgi:hypothetical protein